jgi:hypothetical protein
VGTIWGRLGEDERREDYVMLWWMVGGQNIDIYLSWRFVFRDDMCFSELACKAVLLSSLTGVDRYTFPSSFQDDRLYHSSSGNDKMSSNENAWPCIRRQGEEFRYRLPLPGLG